MASLITAPSRVIRSASHFGTRPPCSGRSALLAPRSIYHLTGEARHEWEHSIAEMAMRRWSITFRSLSKKGVRLAD
jgi:hypothetical protein